MDTQDLYAQSQAVELEIELIEKEIKNFNWGAFGFGWLWGAFNGAFKPTAALVIFLFVVTFFVT